MQSFVNVGYQLWFILAMPNAPTFISVIFVIISSHSWLVALIPFMFWKNILKFPSLQLTNAGRVSVSYQGLASQWFTASPIKVICPNFFLRWWLYPEGRPFSIPALKLPHAFPFSCSLLWTGICSFIQIVSALSQDVVEISVRSYLQIFQ